MTETPKPPATWTTYGDALRMFLAGATLPSAGRIALIVGTWLSIMNQGERILEGDIPWLPILLDYATPFTVASLGFLAARRRSNVERLIAQYERQAPNDRHRSGGT